MPDQVQQTEQYGVEHLAIIMDGNGRWAKTRGRPRSFGHRAGVEAVRRTVRNAPKLGVRHLTLYAFSSENWSRPADEISDLLGLLKFYVRSDLADLAAAGVCVRIIGSREGLKPDILNLINMAESKTAHNSKLYLNIAFNYGGRDEIVRAVQKVVDDPTGVVAKGGKLTVEDITAAMDTARGPDPDLVIRTSGEKRISNFLLWQIAYAELVFVECMWPDFDMEHLTAAFEEYRSRDRRYGGVVSAEGVAL